MTQSRVGRPYATAPARRIVSPRPEHVSAADLRAVSAGTTADRMLLTMLADFNESDDSDRILQRTVDLVTTALGGRVGEIWLTDDATGVARLDCWSSPDHSGAMVAFTDAARRLGPASGPAAIGGVLTTGRARTAHAVDDWMARHDQAAALDLGSGVVFPIRIGGAVGGALAVFGAPVEADPLVVAALPVACHHIGRFIDRVRAGVSIQAAAKELSAMASTDSLTGLKNRREFDRALRTIPRQPFAIISIDVDTLKQVNDLHGHAAGDALLRMVGTTLGLIVRGWDVVARVGGDEFAALLPAVGPFGAAIIAERMRIAMHSLLLPTGPARITVGWSAAPAGADPVSVWQTADESLYSAKRAGRDRVAGCSYERGEAGDIADRSYSEVVTRILEGGLLHTVFQPIVQLRTGAVMGFEALARPEGFAPMDNVEDVFEAARNSGRIRDLDWLCRGQAIRDAAALPAEVDLFLNMSAGALLDPLHGVDQLLRALKTAARPARTVVVEITEHELIRDYDALGRVLALYRAEGIRFALDDVGEGHSTLELLAASRSEFLKLGRSVTMTSTRTGSHAALEATLAFARASGATVIAEGVENEFVADLMKEAGIQFGQGFGLGRPTLADDVEDVGTALAGRAALSRLRPRRAGLRAG